jgi:hypothetical protein
MPVAPGKEVAVPLVTVVIGALLVALGGWGWLGAEVEHRSVTALIPAFVGGPLIVLGLLALKESFLKHAMHLASLVGLLGFLMAGGRLVVKLLQDGKIEGRGGLSTSLMTMLCGVFVVLCVNSFIQARRRRRSREALANP